MSIVDKKSSLLLLVLRVYNKAIPNCECDILNKELGQMTILVCQDCEETIDYLPDEKVGVMYGKCSCCSHDEVEQEIQF